MIRNSIENIQKKIRETDSLKEQEKQELLNLLSNLEAEVLSLSKTHPEQAESITRAERTMPTSSNITPRKA